MRRLLFAFLFALTLFSAAPVTAARDVSEPFYTEIGRHFMIGARFYGQAISGWTWMLLTRLGLSSRFTVVNEGENCTQFSRCAQGLVCLNTCKESSCPRFEKHCVVGPKSVPVLGASSICGAENLCVDGTECLRICPVGASCNASHRCVATRYPESNCKIDLDCSAVCGELPAPEIDPGGYVARCAEGACACDPVEILPTAARMNCPDASTTTLACPESTFQACASGENGNAFVTCLRAPEYGGTCLQNEECAKAACPEASVPFCDENRVCKCHVAETKVIACVDALECAGTACGAKEIAACVDGACACAPAGITSACATTSDCSTECPSGYSAACEASHCVCQRTLENIPVACQTVAECGSVSCPSDFEKACLNNVCACTRTTTSR
jgi:hypothetical protein